jgi:hypothetical protein
VKFSSIGSIQIFSVKNANPSINEIYVENDYFPLSSKFEMMSKCQGHTKTQCYIYKVIPVTIESNIKNHGAQWAIPITA